MNFRQLGAHGPRVSALGLGCMGMSDLYGPAAREESLATLHAAIDAGITLLDTADFYGSGHNEMLLRDLLAECKREDIIISGKFGALRDPAGGWGGIDNRPASIKNFLAQSLQRLGTDYIDIYRPARLDPQTPVEETMSTLAALLKKGYIRYIGLSEVSAETIRRAHAIHPICDVQLEWSLFSRGVEESIIPTCRELGIGVTAYGVLSRGLLSGHWNREREKNRDFRTMLPRFKGDNLEHNLAQVEALRAVAQTKDATVAQIAIAWALANGDDVVPLIGARQIIQLQESLGALDIQLTWMDMPDVEAAVPKDTAAGERYPAAMLRDLDSER